MPSSIDGMFRYFIIYSGQNASASLIMKKWLEFTVLSVYLSGERSILSISTLASFTFFLSESDLILRWLLISCFVFFEKIDFLFCCLSGFWVDSISVKLLWLPNCLNLGWLVGMFWICESCFLNLVWWAIFFPFSLFCFLFFSMYFYLNWIYFAQKKLYLESEP